jgi:hypothetical protein
MRQKLPSASIAPELKNSSTTSRMMEKMDGCRERSSSVKDSAASASRPDATWPPPGESERGTETERQRDRATQTERQRDRETETERQRETETERQRDRDREIEK